MKSVSSFCIILICRSFVVNWQLCAPSIQKAHVWRGVANRRRQLIFRTHSHSHSHSSGFASASFPTLSALFGVSAYGNLSFFRAPAESRVSRQFFFSGFARPQFSVCGALLLLPTLFFLLSTAAGKENTYTCIQGPITYSKNKFNFIAFPPVALSCVCVLVLYIFYYIYTYMAWKSNTKIWYVQSLLTTTCCLWFYFGVYIKLINNVLKYRLIIYNKNLHLNCTWQLSAWDCVCFCISNRYFQWCFYRFFPMLTSREKAFHQCTKRDRHRQSRRGRAFPQNETLK